MIRVLIIVPQLKTGGTENHILKLCRGFSEDNVWIMVLCLNINDKGTVVAKQLLDTGISLKFIHLGIGCCYNILRAAYISRKHRFDIIHTFCFSNTIWDSLVYLMSPARVLISERRNIQHWRISSGLGVWEKLRNRITANFVANSSAAKEKAMIIESIPEEQIVVIHNGLEMPNSCSEERKDVIRNKMGYKKNDYIILCVANLKKVKRQEDIIRAIAELHKENTNINCKLILVGRNDQNYKKELNELVNDLHLEGIVEFTGEIKDPLQYMKIADIFVLSSDAEGFSNALLEAAGAGLPIICTRVGGNLDMVQDGKNGLFYEPRSVSQLSKRILKLNKNSPLSEALGAQAQETSKIFSISNMIHKYQCTYMKATGITIPSIEPTITEFSK